MFVKFPLCAHAKPPIAKFAKKGCRFSGLDSPVVKSHGATDYIGFSNSLSVCEKIVKGDLTLSEELINRLVKNALEEIDNANEHSLVLEMNPNDIEQLDKSALIESMQVEFSPNKAILRGDIKVKMGDSVIENFIENRLELIAEELFSDGELTAAEEEKSADKQLGDVLSSEKVNEESVPVSKQDEVNLSDESDTTPSESDDPDDGDETK